ncbi:uncharacterized protein LOC124227751 isoform X2 [Equus quagga]|uniref:uncharacterized protein LOC124227751 isoform X2 n=1 Tax=Equus quagga TaxID=89248 RepID=UPI001EE365CD|nr:uncharacterized protein LOC124227751 isoform X2 [Equus quagga]
MARLGKPRGRPSREPGSVWVWLSQERPWAAAAARPRADSRPPGDPSAPRESRDAAAALERERCPFLHAAPRLEGSQDGASSDGELALAGAGRGLPGCAGTRALSPSVPLEKQMSCGLPRQREPGQFLCSPIKGQLGIQGILCGCCIHFHANLDTYCPHPPTPPRTGSECVAPAVRECHNHVTFGTIVFGLRLEASVPLDFPEAAQDALRTAESHTLVPLTDCARWLSPSPILHPAAAANRAPRGTDLPHLQELGEETKGKKFDSVPSI